MLAALALAGCGREPERRSDASAYVVQVDLGPQIRAFGEDTATADEAGEQLVAIGPAAIPALAAALGREPAKDVRQKAVEVLATIGTPDAVPALLQAAQHDGDEDVRADALRALGAIGDERGRSVLEAALADPRLTVRVGAIMGCASLCTSPGAIDRLADIAVHDESTEVALAARTTLAALRATGAEREQLVRAAIARVQPTAPDAPAEARARAALLLSDVDGASALPVLLAVAGEAPPALQRHVAWRCGTMGDARCIAPLEAMSAAPDRLVQAYAYDALVKLRERGIDGAGSALARYAGQKPVAPLAAPDF
jgi:HEAT repeat protein